ncbi:MAG TPA: copper resistance protein B [Gammaproteobacteria bacterium]|nr:copper resistance protein B [Gammaproteobacteria bacterium]
MRTMSKPVILISTVLLLLGMGTLPAWSAEDTPMEEMNMEGMDHSTMSDMDHNETSKKGNSNAATMDHGDMTSSMQGGSAPADARDPHAYSGGYSIESGKYALPGKRILVLGDEHNFGSLVMDRFESVRTSDNTSATYDLQAWFGRDYDRLVLKSEGDVDNGTLEEASTEVLWNHAIAAFWDSQFGLRFDTNNEGPERNWLALGVQGLAPYWFELDITAYLGEESRSALSIEAEYEILFTQKLVLQPRLEANFSGKKDLQLGTGAGLTDTAFGIRLRYEIRREFAPYVGIEWASLYGDTADMARATGLESNETRVLAGLRFWF